MNRGVQASSVLTSERSGTRPGPLVCLEDDSKTARRRLEGDSKTTRVHEFERRQIERDRFGSVESIERHIETGRRVRIESATSRERLVNGD